MQARPFFQALWRGARHHCPTCDQAGLFDGYLKVRPVCDGCGHENGRYRADDAPPYFTILLVGHLVVAPMLAFPFIWQWPVARVLALTLPIVVILTLALLPRVKGAVVGVQSALAADREATAPPEPGGP
ncbi:MAG TPA: DUF983 domain-containing protein [Caulobacteraceae bacterium]|jgi:uncharacterized protein (DUF983 family)|nr:DUF983 domain-containing protein [Caulobacteraceae bacterium]